MKQIKFTTKLFILLFVFIGFNLTNSMAKSVLYDWNEGQGQKWPGWTWSDDISYGKAGWLRDDIISTLRGPMPRLMLNPGYGNLNMMTIDTDNRAPSTDLGGCLKVFELPESDVHQCAIFNWSGSSLLRDEGVVGETTEYLEFYLRTEGMSTFESGTGNGSSDSVSGGNFHIGTYLCWGSGQATGAGCPYEGPGNQHYYHYLTINPGTWLHVKLDKHPTIRREQHKSYYDEPFKDDEIHHYWHYLSEMYTEIRYEQPNPTEMYLDEFIFLTTDDLIEKNQNNLSITSIYVGYWSNSDYWEMGWQDCSYDDEEISLNDYTQSTFEIRWSLSPITNDNFSNANQIIPLKYGGVDYCGSGGEHLIHRPNSWLRVAWTRFQLPDDIEKSNSIIYFAVKDVSVKGRHVGTVWPWKKGDGHDAPTDYIKTINYNIRSGGNLSVPPSVPMSKPEIK